MYHMYSLTARFHSIFIFFIYCLGLLISFNIFTTIFTINEPIINKFNFYSTTLYNNPYTGVQHSSGEIDLDVNYEPCFDWNTNLIFSWISATYITNGKNTSVTIWDRIMRRDKPETHTIKQDNLHLRYPLIDKFSSLSEKDVYIELHWEHMPVFGPILKFSMPLGNFKLRKDTTIPSKKELISEYDYSDINRFRK